MSNKEYINDHRCERTNMAAKCKLFVSHSKINRHLQKQIWPQKKFKWLEMSKTPIWLTNIKYLWLSLHILLPLVLCIGTCVYNFKSFDINEEKLSAKWRIINWL